MSTLHPDAFSVVAKHHKELGTVLRFLDTVLPSCKGVGANVRRMLHDSTEFGYLAEPLRLAYAGFLGERGASFAAEEEASRQTIESLAPAVLAFSDDDLTEAAKWAAYQALLDRLLPAIKAQLDRRQRVFLPLLESSMTTEQRSALSAAMADRAAARVAELEAAERAAEAAKLRTRDGKKAALQAARAAAEAAAEEEEKAAAAGGGKKGKKAAAKAAAAAAAAAGGDGSPAANGVAAALAGKEEGGVAGGKGRASKDKGVGAKVAGGSEKEKEKGAVGKDKGKAAKAATGPSALPSGMLTPGIGSPAHSHVSAATLHMEQMHL